MKLTPDGHKRILQSASLAKKGGWKYPAIEATTTTTATTATTTTTATTATTDSKN